LRISDVFKIACWGKIKHIVRKEFRQARIYDQYQAIQGWLPRENIGHPSIFGKWLRYAFFS